MKPNGFSLLETLIVLGLMGSIMVSLFLTLYGILGGQVAVSQKTLTEEEGNFLLRKIEWALVGSTITTPGTNSTSTTLVLTKYNFGANPITFGNNGTMLTLQTGPNPPLPLHNSSIALANLVFQNTLPYATSSIILLKTSFTLNNQLFSSETYVQQ